MCAQCARAAPFARGGGDALALVLIASIVELVQAGVVCQNGACEAMNMLAIAFG